MARRAMRVLTTALLALSVAPAIRAQEPARGRGAGAVRVTRPPLFLREEWKQTPAGGEHPVVVSEAMIKAPVL